MSRILIPLLSIILFQGILFLMSGLSSFFNEIENGFTLFIDTTSKAATIAVFIWAIFLFIEQRKEKKQENSLQRMKELSFRLIDFIGNPNFSLNKNSANILLTYLATLKSESRSSNSTTIHLKEYELALNIVYESLKNVNLVDIIGIECTQDYSEILDTLIKHYSCMAKLSQIDNDLASRIEKSEVNSTNYKIGAPSHGLKLWQIKQLMSFLLEKDDTFVEKELKRKPNSILDRHHYFPPLYAYYYFYTEGSLHVSRDKSLKFGLGSLLMSCG